jgi:hypothetical protein
MGLTHVSVPSAGDSNQGAGMAYSEAALRELLDEREISRSILDLARAQDRRDWDLVLAAYHPDAIDDHGGVLGPLPVKQFLEAARVGAPQLFQNTAHIISAIRIDVDGDVARVESRISHRHIYVPDDDGKTKVGNGEGRYIDRFERRDGVWKIAYRRWILDISYVVAEDMTAEFDFAPEHMGTHDKTDPSYFGPETPFA